MKNRDMPAMAVKVVASINAQMQAKGSGTFLDDVTYTGLTKREHFAGLAMQGLLRQGIDCSVASNEGIEMFAGLSVSYADALLEALEAGDENRT